jgi:hypothetical protein
MWKMIGGFFLIWMLMESFGYLVLYSWLLSVILELYLILGEFLLLIFYVLFEFLFVISTIFSCEIVVFVGLIDCYIVRCAFWAVIRCCFGCFHVLTAVLLSSLITDSCWSWGVFFFLSYWNVCCGYKSSTGWKMVYVVDLSLFSIGWRFPPLCFLMYFSFLSFFTIYSM